MAIHAGVAGAQAGQKLRPAERESLPSSIGDDPERSASLRTRVADPARSLMAQADAWLSASLLRIGEAPVNAYGLLRIALFLLLAVMLSRVLRHLIARFSARDAGRPSAGLYTVVRGGRGMLDAPVAVPP